MGYMAFNISQFGHDLSPCIYLLRIKIPPIHEKASLAWLCQYMRRFCPSGVADLFFFGIHNVLDVPSEEKIKNS
jgi:hypothetical protein